jgi:hypothetical protein|tara:strand:- start:497 stop:628 length:132 start_codon:yes stop_codon:yes gene_type:complete
MKYNKRLNIRISEDDYDYLIENEVPISVMVREAIEKHRRRKRK